MKGCCLILLALLFNPARAVYWRGNHAQQQLSFSFPPPEPGPMQEALVEPATPRVSTEIAETLTNTQVRQMESQLQAAADEAVGRVQEALNVHEPPSGPAEEKQVKAREKGGFLTTILKKAAESFSSTSLANLQGMIHLRALL